jgi:hypothetical protein
MADSRCKERGYSASLLEEDHGAYLRIRRGGTIVGDVAIGIFSGGHDAPVRIVIKRFRPDELREVAQVDDFDDK